jgi:ATP-dependent Clp protease adaptor protein ClpS
MESMATAATTVAPERTRIPETGEEVRRDRPWLVIVHNDPINLMSYVTWVFQTLFGYPLAKAHKLMLQVHNEGKAVVSSGPREKAEADCYRLHAHGLWATLSKSD